MLHFILTLILIFIGDKHNYMCRVNPISQADQLPEKWNVVFNNNNKNINIYLQKSLERG